jgi:hypothetical protein
MLKNTLLIGLLFITPNTYASEQPVDNYEFYAKWQSNPDIYVCKDAKVNKETIGFAVKFWQKRNIRFGSINFNANCKNVKGIKIKGQNDLNTFDRFGETSLKKRGEYLVSAEILISDSYSDDPELITHELGHAIGILHTEEKSDIMYTYHMHEATKGSPNQFESVLSRFLNIDL